METLCLGLGAVDSLRRVEDQGHVFVAPTDLTQQFQTSLRIALLHMGETTRNRLHRETGIRDHAQRVIMVLLIDLHRLLIVRGEHHLGASALTLSSGMGVQGLRRETLRLGEDIVIEVWQDGRVETDVILHQQDHLHTGLLDVVLDVHLVLQQFDDRHDKVGITQPAEHIIEHRHILVLDALRDTMRERRKYHTGNRGMSRLHLTGHREGIVVGITWHTDHEIDIRRAQHLVGLLCCRYLCEGRWVAHTQLHIFVENLLIDAPVVFEHEGVVRVSHDEHIEDAPRHQVHKRHILQIKLIPLLWYLACFFHTVYFK